ncbi:MAG TPA: sigma-70 family RNA polymerase sigma factor [Pirellulales bacterium]|nr:sigma-70 family RNA polymerase sigma factor [Pirellulales bacterium]
MSSVIETEVEELLRLAHGGDSEALGRLLELYRGYLSLLARLQIGRRLQGKVDAADLVQDTFLEAHRHFGAFRGSVEAELVSWLRQILAGLLANLVRRYCGTQRRDVTLERELANELDRSSAVLDRGLAGGHSTPSERASRREQAVLLADALERLPDDYREVIILRHLEGLSFAEISDRMGRSVDSVKNLWARALAQLRRSLGATDGKVDGRQ